jgi:hypothetical protein
MSRLGRLTVAAVIAIATVSVGLASDKKDFTERYKDKYLVVLRDGLAVGTCGEHPADTGFHGHTTTLPLKVKISGDAADYKPDAGFGAGLTGCGQMIPDPVHKGEVLRTRSVGFHKGGLMIIAETVNAHQVDRGVGAFGHQSYEQAAAELIFLDCDPSDTDACPARVDRWVKVFESNDEAAKFGNTASGAFVKEVKLGMTSAEVESVLGLPETKIDLGEKVLYKYKNMTVEFKDGKVSDVR